MVRGLATGQDTPSRHTTALTRTPPEKDRAVRRLDGQDRSGDRWRSGGSMVRRLRWSGGGQVVQGSQVSVSVPSAFLARPYAKSVPNQVKNR